MGGDGDRRLVNSRLSPRRETPSTNSSTVIQRGPWGLRSCCGSCACCGSMGVALSLGVQLLHELHTISQGHEKLSTGTVLTELTRMVGPPRPDLGMAGRSLTCLTPTATPSGVVHWRR